MYIFPDMIDLGFEDNQNPQWKSEAHKKVAQTVLLCNPTVKTRDDLIEGVKIINAIPNDQIKKVTISDLRKLGCPGIYP